MFRPAPLPDLLAPPALPPPLPPPTDLRREARGVRCAVGRASQFELMSMGDDEYDGLAGRISQVNGRCDAARGKAAQLAFCFSDANLRHYVYRA